MTNAAVVALGLFSGGLDSILATCILMDQGVSVVAFHLKLPFGPLAGAGRDTARAADKLGVPFLQEDAGRSYVTAMLHPRHGRGTALNPCMDCKVFMLKRAADRMADVGAAFLFTGEVLGQRPMSQKRPQLDLIARKAGLEGRLLRPLSALLLPPTEAESRGWVDRRRLLALSGRGRKGQLALAAERRVDFFSPAAGGCLLTDRSFCARLADAAQNDADVYDEIPFLKVGRHFRLPTNAKVIVGRNRDENAALVAMAGEADVLFESAEAAGATAVLRGGDRADWPAAAALAHAYSDARSLPQGRVKSWTKAGVAVEVAASTSAVDAVACYVRYTGKRNKT